MSINKLFPKISANNLMASVVVFLVALPLCMGIALASGISPEKGIITGIVGGLIVGFIAGSPLQVSGPAAGLVVIVWQVIEKVGLEGLGAAILVAGLIQVGAGILGAGQIFRAVSPTVIYGMLSGIGVLIFGSQFHVMIDDTPLSNGVENLLTIPSSLIKALPFNGDITHSYAAGIGLFTVCLIIAWEKFRPKSLRMLPGALVGIIGATSAALLFNLDIRYVDLPTNILASLKPISPSATLDLISLQGVMIVLSLAIVASAETLLCATAVDRMHDGEKTNYNKELIAQGIGNMICGLFAALPMTGVIVRSSANVQAGGTNRSSAILHGVWLLAFVVALPSVLKLIPTASLAALLVVIGWKLMNFSLLKELRVKGNEELLIFLLTVSSIVCFDLLTGIMIGVSATILQLIYRLTHLEVDIEKNEAGKHEYNLELSGAATFLRIPTLAKALGSLPEDSVLHVHLKNLLYVDHACLELLTEWGDQHERSGGRVLMEWDDLHHHVSHARLRTSCETNTDTPQLIQGGLSQGNAVKRASVR